MLGEKDSIDKINRFVTDPPGAWRMTDRTEVEGYYDRDSITLKRPTDREQAMIDKIAVAEIYRTEMSPYCDSGLCAKQSEQAFLNKTVHPRRNIDYGVDCKPKKISVGVSKKTSSLFVPDSIKIAIVAFILMSVAYIRR